MHELFEDFGGGKVASEVKCARAAEAAGHSATDLAGEARGQGAVAVGEEDAFDDAAVMQFQGKFCGALGVGLSGQNCA